MCACVYEVLIPPIAEFTESENSKHVLNFKVSEDVLQLTSSLEYERIRVVSVFEPSVCLFACSLLVSKFTHFLYYKVL